ncbi:MAG: hypothetical protein L3J20_13965, partial [Flavobacteriaceae bacterium]|nr:hypothetical protein [Flavobacteriaceae bacterium]
MQKNQPQYSIILFFILMMGLTFNISAQETFMFEAEDFTIADPANIDSSYLVVDDASAMGEKYLRVTGVTTKSKIYAGYEFTTTSATDTTYYVWVKTRPWNNYWNSSTNKHYLNWNIPDSIIERGGSAFPFQGMTYNAMSPQIATGDTLEWRWYLVTDAASAAPLELNLQAGAQNFFWRIRAGIAVFDQIKITNDLNWRPDIAIEYEAESGAIVEPLVIEGYDGASMDSVVSAPAGSGTIAQTDLVRGNDDLGVVLTQAPGDYYVWLLVDLPSESSNSYWVGTGDEQIMPPSWEGDVTNGLKWQRVEDAGVPKVFPFTPG